MEINDETTPHSPSCGCVACFKDFRDQHHELKGTFRRTIAIGVASAALAVSGVVYAGHSAYETVSEAVERAVCWQQSLAITAVTSTAESDSC